MARRRTLSICSAAGVVAITVAAIVLGFVLVTLLASTPKSQFQREEDKPWVILAGCCRVFNVLQASLGVAGYVAVSAGRPRPLQLHVCMLGVWMALPCQVLYIAAMILKQRRSFEGVWSVNIIRFLIFGSRKAILYLVVKQKLTVLASPGQGCQKVGAWVISSIVSSVVAVGGGVAIWSLAIALRLRGSPLEDPAEAASSEASAAVSASAARLMRLLYVVANVGISLGFVTSVVVLALARHLVKTTVSRLAARGVAAAMLSKVRGTLRLHLLGMVASIGSGWAVTVGGAVNFCNLLGTDAGEDALSSMLTTVDVGGDVTGLILLSGVWGLLFREDPDAGDFNRCIRSLLWSTVLTSRASSTFEGSVFRTKGNRCVASFPGRFMEDWSQLTWRCEQQELSSACVFLPHSDPKRRFGEHAECPEDPTKRCWCYQLYGGEKPWGCLWFDVWRSNIKKAVELGLDLVVVFFPGQVGTGLVDWEKLPATDLWDGVGLGGSQKAEVAFLRRCGLDVIEMDLEEARRLWLRSSPNRVESPAASSNPR